MILKNKKLHEQIYEKISSIYGITFKTQLNGSPIEFQSFIKFNNLITDQESLLLTFVNEDSIKFKNKSEFIKEFSNYVYCKLIELEDQFKELNSREYHGIKHDENEIFLQHEEIGNGQHKLNQILEKFKILKS